METANQFTTEKPFLDLVSLEYLNSTVALKKQRLLSDKEISRWQTLSEP